MELGTRSMKTVEMMVEKWFALVIHMKGIALLLYVMSAGLVTYGEMVSLFTRSYPLCLDMRILNL